VKHFIGFLFQNLSQSDKMFGLSKFSTKVKKCKKKSYSLLEICFLLPNQPNVSLS